MRTFVAILAALVLACGDLPMSDVSSWDPTAGNNTSTPPDGAPEGMAPSTVNDTMREMMAAVRRDQMDDDVYDYFRFTVKRGQASGFTDVLSIPDIGVLFGESGTASSVIDDDGWWIKYTSASNNGWTPTIPVYTRHSPVLTASVKTGASIADVYIAIGFGSNTLTASSTPAASSSTHYAMVRYDTAADGTAFWRYGTGDGSTDNLTASTVGIAADTRYDIRVETTITTADFYIKPSGGAWTHLGQKTSNLPTKTTSLTTNVLGKALSGSKEFLISQATLQRN